MKIVLGKKSGYESPQLDFLRVMEDVLLASNPEDADVGKDTIPWD